MHILLSLLKKEIKYIVFIFWIFLFTVPFYKVYYQGQEKFQGKKDVLLKKATTKKKVSQDIQSVQDNLFHPKKAVQFCADLNSEALSAHRAMHSNNNIYKRTRGLEVSTHVSPKIPVENKK